MWSPADSFQETSLDSQDLFISQELGGDPMQTAPDASAPSLIATSPPASECSQLKQHPRGVL